MVEGTLGGKRETRARVITIWTPVELEAFVGHSQMRRRSPSRTYGISTVDDFAKDLGSRKGTALGEALQVSRIFFNEYKMKNKKIS